MISVSDAYRAAVSADTRRTVVKVETDVTDPDLKYNDFSGVEESVISVHEQTLKNSHDISRYATLERNYWILDGSYDVFDDDYKQRENRDKIGFVSNNICPNSGVLPSPQVIEIALTYHGLLQAAEVMFSQDVNDGVPSDFTVDIWAGSVKVYSWSETDNKDATTQREGFEAYNPDRIVITIRKWSVPARRTRLRYVLPGLHLVWSGDDIASLSVQQNTDPSCATLPYGTAKLSIDNSGKKFEPRNKTGYFRSIQERQKVDIYIGLYANGNVEYKSIGSFYQKAGGWSTSDNGLSIDWELVDIIGILGDRKYVPLETIPKTLDGWASSLVAQLGENFAERYQVDAEYKDIPVTLKKWQAVKDSSVADMIRFLCLSTGTWPRADAETGYLTFEPLWDQGTRISLNDMANYPNMYENEDVSQVTITKPELIDKYTGKIDYEEENVFGGTNLASSKAINIETPFLVDEVDASRIFTWVISQFGGNAFDITWRGDPTAETGDVVTLELDESNAISARIIEQSFEYGTGVLANCKAKLIQPHGYWTYANGEKYTEDSVFTVPENVQVIKIIVVGGGRAGAPGSAGDFEEDGSDGADGIGGKILATEMNVVPGTNYSIRIGAGCENWFDTPGASCFGDISSDSGKNYTPAYTDILSGSAYGRKGVRSALPNTGDGGKGGKGGKKGKNHTGKKKDDYGFVEEITVVDRAPTPGTAGTHGASGCVVVYWN